MNRSLRVWAPDAHRVDVVVGAEEQTAARESHGWWRGPRLHEGDLYWIRIDGGPPRPDPRSTFQPQGVHGPSCWLDTATLGAPGPAPYVSLRDAVIYELHVGTFTQAGTFSSAVEHLDDLVELGVTHVELMPIAQFPGVHGWGYDGVDLYAAHTPYGGPPGLRDLIAECHARGLAVIIDVVHNHFGPEGAYLAGIAPYKTSHHITPWGDAINLDDVGSDEVRRFLIDSAIAWLRDFGADGLRLDALHALYDDSEHHFVEQLVDEVRVLERDLDRRFVLIGEYDHHDPKVLIEWGLDAHWNDDFHHAVHALVTGEHDSYYVDFVGKLGTVLEHGYALDGGFSKFRGERHGRPFGALSRDRLVAYVQSHDQVGNRPRGERLHQLAGFKRAQLAAALLLTSPFVPMLFQGEEWAASTPFLYFAQLESEQLRRAVREGRRKEHRHDGVTPPDPEAPSTRDASVLRWRERGEGEHAQMLAWYRTLIAARRAHPALRDPSPEATRVEEHGGLLTVHRDDLALVCNFTKEPRRMLAGELLVASSGSHAAHELSGLACALVRRR
ncbi:MAG TPA: malto-oligosyltrehalose trehalohydrolase [Kofleriaceae bacterium]|nr:malto-oligosyltrehalose trehalohydrolase [Kofleriaceae bacterium]